MNYQIWSWVLGVLGLLGFYLAGKKVWWSWYINIFNQTLWLAYSLISHQYGFLVATAGYTIVFVKNAISWTREHRDTWDLKHGEVIGRVTDVRDNKHGLEIDMKFNSEDFVNKIQQMQKETPFKENTIRPGWSPACLSSIVYNGQPYFCAHRENHTKALHLVNHWTRIDACTDARKGPKIVDLFWDDLGLSHVIEVKD